MAATEIEKYELAKAALGSNIARHDMPSLGAYFRVYDSKIMRQMQRAAQFSTTQDLVLHENVLQIISTLKNMSKCNKKELREQVFSALGSGVRDLDCQNVSINAAVQLMYMVDCDALVHHSSFFTVDSWRPSTWRDDQLFSEFMARVLPWQVHAHEGLHSALEDKRLLTARSLVKRLRVHLQPTNSLADHLRLDTSDQAHSVLYIFHHTTFLKTQLRLNEKMNNDHGLQESLQRGCLPRQLIIETLVSLQSLLFPASDEKSDRLLLAMAAGSEAGFDRDCLIHDRYSTDLNPADVFYFYWGERIAKLYLAVKSPRPRSGFMTWVDDHTSERNALYIAILGLFLAVLFGLIGIIVGIIQTIISYQAWKHPYLSQYPKCFKAVERYQSNQFRQYPEKRSLNSFNHKIQCLSEALHKGCRDVPTTFVESHDSSTSGTLLEKFRTKVSSKLNWTRTKSNT